MYTKDYFEQNGYAVINALITPQQLTEIEQQLEQVNLTTAGNRELLTLPWCQLLANDLKTNTLLTTLLPEKPIAIQYTLFKKSADKNWLVPLHQDLSIAVRHRFSDSRFIGWSHKQNILFVHPPAQYMQQLVAVRLHIDDCLHEHGPLKVVAGTHQHGRIAESELRQLRDQQGEQECILSKGGAVIMRPLIVHSSSKAIQTNGRRVLHFLYAPATLAETIPFQFCI
ncbi:hypothetical protein BGI32_06245 [Snodgrassella alvi]|uniref:Phytanoyl-CoA dioxygenase n=1 Tax=Snodgrassella alvi TaxID=1196083 RepID=A0A2N9WTU0_9NEIS|nr:phytanoyl-CoA dioxygenase family protein [Snodgrassella alvi]PIT15095.1 hypothetical protein BGI32_06245 [Snodgrassella alvi]